MAAGFASAGWLKIWWNAALGGLVTGVVAAFLSAPIAAYVFGGVTGQAGTDVLVASFKAAGLDNLSASLGQGIMSDTLDKLITFLIVWAILLVLPERLKKNTA
jgi:energy-coupling factor transport system substrate-specific component